MGVHHGPLLDAACSAEERFAFLVAEPPNEFEPPLHLVLSVLKEPEDNAESQLERQHLNHRENVGEDPQVPLEHLKLSGLRRDCDRYAQ